MKRDYTRWWPVSKQRGRFVIARLAHRGGECRASLEAEVDLIIGDKK